MPVDPVIHAHMAYLLQQEKKELEEAHKLEDEIEVWKKRIQLAEGRGMQELADQARERARALVQRRRELQTRLDMIDTEKGMLRKESRRPGGREVAYAEELLARWQESGLVDPDQAVLDRQFSELGKEAALEALREEMGEDPGAEAGQQASESGEEEFVFPDLSDDLDEDRGADSSSDDHSPA